MSNVINPKELSYTGEIYKYDQTEEEFTDASLYTFNIPYSAFSGDVKNVVSVPLTSFATQDGEYIIKSYWQYNINTLLCKQLERRRNSFDTYKRGNEYLLYDAATDWYFVNVFEALPPLFTNSETIETPSLNTLVVDSQRTVTGQTDYFFDSLSEPIVAYNGAVLYNQVEYSAITTGSTPFVRLFLPEILDDQVLTIAYVLEGQPSDIYVDQHVVTTVPSGATDNQGPTDKVYFNTTQGNYEYYLDTTNNSDIVLTINGSVQENGVDYYLSDSDPNRLILDDVITLTAGDRIVAFYVPSAPIIGSIPTNKFVLSWYINSAPTNTDGRFIAQFAAIDDVNFDTILYEFETDYVIDQKTYNVAIDLADAKAGDEFLYRVVNEKFYTPIIGETIYSVNYSESISITITTNKGNTY